MYVCTYLYTYDILHIYNNQYRSFVTKNGCSIIYAHVFAAFLYRFFPDFAILNSSSGVADWSRPPHRKPEMGNRGLLSLPPQSQSLTERQCLA